MCSGLFQLLSKKMAVLYESMLRVNQGAPPWGITGKISEIKITFSLL